VRFLSTPATYQLRLVVGISGSQASVVALRWATGQAELIRTAERSGSCFIPVPYHPMDRATIEGFIAKVACSECRSVEARVAPTPASSADGSTGNDAQR
jgi:hypothetical protein